MSAIAPSANRRLATKSEAFPDWMPAVRPRRSPSDPAVADRRGLGRRASIHCDSLVEFEIRLRKQRNSGAFRRDRRSRDDRVVAALREAVEDPVEVGARVPHRPQGEAELRTNRAHEFDVETAR